MGQVRNHLLRVAGIEVRAIQLDEEHRYDRDVEESVECQAPDEPAIALRRFNDVQARDRFLESIARNTIQLRHIVVGDNWLVMVEREETAALISSRMGVVHWKPY